MTTGTLAKLGLLFGSFVLCIAIAEVGARLALPTQYYVWPPNTHRTDDTTGEYLHGVWGPSGFTINARGMRGESYDEAYRYRILAVGGSTTICAVLGDDEAWPRVVQELVNEVLGEATAFVGNVGRPGHSSADHALQIEKLLEQHDDLDAVILLAGVNDMLLALNSLRGFGVGEGTLKPDPERRLRRAFSVIPTKLEGPWYTRSGIASWLETRRFRAGKRDGPVVDAGGGMFLKQREYRRNSNYFVDDLPNLKKVLKVYRNKLNGIVDLARAKRVRLILLTQPSIWRDGLPKEVEDRLWTGGPPLNQPQENREYYSVRVLAAAMAAFNRTVLGVCRARDVECIDVSSGLPKDGDFFWDDIHYTERGSRRLAKIVAGHLLGTEPLALLQR